MSALDIFNGKSFSMVDLTTAVNRNPYRPGFLGALNLFESRPIRTEAAMIELADGTLNLIPTSLRGAPLAEGTREKRKVFYQETARIAKGHTIQASEVQNARAFGSESELASAIQLVADVLNGPTGLIAQIEYTWEHMRLGAIQGIVTDADGGELVNWFTVLGESQPSEVDFDLDNATPTSWALRKLCASTVRGIQRKLAGMWLEGSSRIMALCGDAFFDDLVNHADVVETYRNWQAAADLRADRTWRSFPFGGIEWVNYRGSDDNSTVAIHTDKVKFVPVGVPGLFQVAHAPAEFLPFVNSRGLPMYSMTLIDRDRQAWVRPEVYSYPLFICTKPSALFRGKRT